MARTEEKAVKHDTQVSGFFSWWQWEFLYFFWLGGSELVCNGEDWERRWCFFFWTFEFEMPCGISKASKQLGLQVWSSEDRCEL